MHDERLGTSLGGFRIDAKIGEGGMGVVYRAEQLALSRPVALKLIAREFANDAAFRERFERESRLAASIDHPNVVPVFEAGEVDGLLFIAMRCVEGIDLRAAIESEGRLAPGRAADLTRQIAAALDAAHAKGLVHRDVKPANVLLTGGPGEEHAYLTDFGLSKRASSQSGATKTGEWVGTLDYVAPEQIEGRSVDGRTDVYALGCLLHQLLTGEVPYVRDSDVAKMYAHLSAPPPAVTLGAPDVPRGFDAVIQRAMAKDPADRYPSAGDMGRAAVAAATGAALAGPERSVALGAAAAVALGAAAAQNAEATEVSPGPTRVAGGRAHSREAERATPAPIPVLKPRNGRTAAIAAGVLVAGLAIVGAALAVAGVVGEEKPRSRGGTAQRSVTQAAPETPDRSRSTPRVPAPVLLSWPPDTSAWTVVLASKETREKAEAVAQRADQAGLSDVGVLNSSNHSSLRPGLWVAYAGVVDRAEADRLSEDAVSAGFDDAYPRFVTAAKK